MRELFPDCRVIGHDAIVPQTPDDHPDFWAIWEGIVKAAHPEPIDRLFAGEAYGRQLAERVGGEFIMVGPRVHAGLSGTAVRADPWAHWDRLPGPVRAHYARTICLHGPESTGKSTLAPRLAEHFETIWVPEYGRVHCELYGLELDANGLATIAQTQSAMTRAALPWCNRRLIVDTDALTTAAWSIMLLGEVPPAVLEDVPAIDLYLLSDIDVPWADDGSRYFPEPERPQPLHAGVRRGAGAGRRQLGPDQRRSRHPFSPGGRGDRRPGWTRPGIGSPAVIPAKAGISHGPYLPCAFA